MRYGIRKADSVPRARLSVFPDSAKYHVWLNMEIRLGKE